MYIMIDLFRPALDLSDRWRAGHHDEYLHIRRLYMYYWCYIMIIKNQDNNYIDYKINIMVRKKFM